MKLVIYNKQNSQPVGQRNGERTLRFNRENGMIYISKSFAAELGIKDIDKVQFANDEENTKDWFICKTDSEQGFSIKYDKGGIRFMNKFLSNKILDCAKVKDNASFLMEKEPITVDGTKYFKIMLSSPIIVKRSPSKKVPTDKSTDKMVFVTDSEDSDEYIENLRTEYATNWYCIKIDRTLNPPYYQLFHEWKEGKRKLNNRLFASSKLEKIVNYINQNIQ
ncbi:hypothetical protein I100019A1_08300 [Phocaeicola vulgatus]